MKALARQLALHIDFVDFRKEVADVIDALCQHHLDVERLKTDGEYTNHLPADFNLAVIEVVRNAFQACLDEYDNTQIAEIEAQRVQREVKQYMADGLIANREQLLVALRVELEDTAKEYAAAPLFANRETLEQDYEEARKITLTEFIKGNMDDIFTFRNTMEKYVRAVCENMVFRKLGGVYKALACAI